MSLDNGVVVDQDGFGGAEQSRHIGVPAAGVQSRDVAVHCSVSGFSQDRIVPLRITAGTSAVPGIIAWAVVGALVPVVIGAVTRVTIGRTKATPTRTICGIRIVAQRTTVNAGGVDHMEPKSTGAGSAGDCIECADCAV